MTEGRPPKIKKNGNYREGTGSGPNPPPGMALNRFDQEAIADEYNPTRQMLQKMLGDPHQSFDPNDQNSLFWAVGRKFTAELKVKYLQETAKWGRANLACVACGVSPGTVIRHREADKRFDELVRMAESYYRESTAALLMQQAREGMLERKWNSAGQIISERRTFETQLRLKLLDWCDPSFNQAHKVETTIQGGAVMVPSPVESVDDWARVLAQLEAGASPGANYSVPTTGTNNPQLPALEQNVSEFDPDSLDTLANSILATGTETTPVDVPEPTQDEGPGRKV